MLLFLMSKDPVLSTVSMRECSQTVLNVHFSQTCSENAVSAQERPLVSADVSPGIAICEVL